jgi:hypothetical protein
MKIQKQIINAGLLFTLTLSLFMIYANSKFEIKILSWTLKKSEELRWANTPQKRVTKQKVKSSISKTKVLNIDTTHQRFLLIGDSQIEGLQYPFHDYCVKNNHELVLACTWYSSTDMTYATNDTLKHLIESSNPTHIVFAIGLNQTFQTYFDPSKKAIDSIKKYFNGIPYSWIGPACWIEDKGINSLYQQEIDSNCFFLSKNLILSRAKDGRHPSQKGNQIWMDSIAYWMQNESKHHIRMNKPDSAQKRRNYKKIIYSVQH